MNVNKPFELRTRPIPYRTQSQCLVRQSSSKQQCGTFNRIWARWRPQWLFANNYCGCLVRPHNNMRLLPPRVQRPKHPQQFLKSENLIRPPITIFRWLYPSGTPHESKRCLDRPDPHDEAFVAALINVTQGRAYDSRRTTLPSLCFQHWGQ
jgi:hypothetical protein